MLHLLSGIDRTSIRAALTAHLHDVTTAAPSGDRGLVAQAEAEVKRDPAAHFRFDTAGRATLHACGRSFRAGRFETPRLGDLRRRAQEARQHAGHPDVALRFHVLDGASPATDIGALQAHAPEGSLFQVASQFNCLEAPSAGIVPVAAYFDDYTQGPRASISAFPGTLLRHYAAPAADGTRFVQGSHGREINLLADVCAPGLCAVRSGYLTSGSIAEPAVFARLLEERFDDLRVGVHDDVEVVLGHDWDGPVPGAPDHAVAQVLTSTLAAGGYGRLSPDDAAMLAVVQGLQRAAYGGTLLAAAALGKSYVALTLIGGGVFGNPVPVIWEAMLWAVDMIRPLLHRDLCVVVNGYGLGRSVPRETLRAAASARGGVLAVFDRASVTVD